MLLGEFLGGSEERSPALGVLLPDLCQLIAPGLCGFEQNGSLGGSTSTGPTLTAQSLAPAL